MKEANTGLCNATAYPYVARYEQQSGCSLHMAECTTVPDTKILGWEFLDPNEQSLKEGIRDEVVSVLINSSGVRMYSCNIFVRALSHRL